MDKMTPKREGEQTLNQTKSANSSSKILETYPSSQCSETYNIRSELDSHIQTSHRGRCPCPICGKFLSLACLSHHHKRVHLKIIKDKPAFCSICQKYFSNSSVLASHMKTHSGLKPYRCQWCERKSFRRMDTLRQHISSIHTKEKTYQCVTCKKYFISNGALKVHQLVHKSIEEKMVVNCPHPECTRRFSHKSQLREHFKRSPECDPTSPSGVQKKVIICSFCPLTFCSRINLQSHVQTHTQERNFTCYFCSKTFRNSSSLHSHIRLVHTRERPNKCTLCPKTFSNATALKRHGYTHQDEKFECKICGKSMRMRSFQEHIKNHQKWRPSTMGINGNENSTILYEPEKEVFACPMCPAKTTTNSGFLIHVQSHTQEKPHVCSFCSRVFAQNSNLRSHVKSVHTGDKSYKCLKCPSAFTTSGYLRQHQVVHQSKVSCHICGKTMTDRSLKRHFIRCKNKKDPIL